MVESVIIIIIIIIILIIFFFFRKGEILYAPSREIRAPLVCETLLLA